MMQDGHTADKVLVYEINSIVAREKIIIWYAWRCSCPIFSLHAHITFFYSKWFTVSLLNDMGKDLRLLQRSGNGLLQFYKMDVGTLLLETVTEQVWP